MTTCLKRNPVIVRITVVILIVSLVFGLSAVRNPVVADNQVLVGTVKDLIVVKESATSLKLRWRKNINAKGYVVYRYDERKRKYKALSDIKDEELTSFTDKNLFSGKVYQYKVHAYVEKKGKRHYGNASYWVKAIPYAASSKSANVRTIKFEDHRLNLGFLDKKKVRVNVKVDRSSEASGKTPLSKSVRWYSSNTKVVAVKQDGSIVTKKKTGTCYIYAIAHNGVQGKIKVTVKDFARPSHFDLNGVEGYAHTLLTAHQDDISEIAGYYHLHRPTKEEIIFLNDGEMFVEPDEDYNLEFIRRAVDNVLQGIPEESLLILVSKRFITFRIAEFTGEDEERNDTGYYHDVRYYYNKDLYDWDPDGYDFHEIAPHWGYWVRDIKEEE